VHHSYLDKYARHDSLLHRLDARVKTLLAMAAVISIASMAKPGVLFFAALLILIAILYALARIPLAYLLTRSAIILPFSLFAAVTLAFSTRFSGAFWEWGGLTLTAEGVNRAAALLLRSFAAVSFMILLINTTPFDQLLRALRWMKIPNLFALLLSFFYRYLYLLWDERERIQRARDVRYFGGRWTRQIALTGNLAASLFLRSYERAERVQKAMLSRGWDGNARMRGSRTWEQKDSTALLWGTLILCTLWLIHRI
jgi:cobalt/nickel transport system permease protein